MLALSETEPWIAITVLDRDVEIDGDAFAIVSDSVPHELVAILLLASPLYVACQLTVPDALNTTFRGPAVFPSKDNDLVTSIELVQVEPE